MDLRKCGKCGLPVSAGACDTPPLVFHTRPEHCIAALRAALSKEQASHADTRRRYDSALDNPIFED